MSLKIKKRQTREAGEDRRRVKPVRRQTRESGPGGNPDLPQAKKRKGPKRYKVDPKEEKVAVVGLKGAAIGGLMTISAGKTAMLPKSRVADLVASGVVRLADESDEEQPAKKAAKKPAHAKVEKPEQSE